MQKFVLFDIDGTLIYSGGSGVKAMNQALESLTGITNGFKYIDCSGKTDLQIIREALQKWRLDSQDGLVGDILDTYLIRLKTEVAKTVGHLKPGVWKLLETLHDTRGIHVGLLTGNIEEGARLKLEPFGLNRFFPVGAFGSDSEERNRLLPVAVQRLREISGTSLGFSDCVVVGDTPRDVACAKIHRARCIAVATGTYSLGQLEATNADLVVSDLSETQHILDWISAV